MRHEARQGQEEGRKDRPCVIVLSVQDVAGMTVVTVAPITHAPPERSDMAVEIPPDTKRRLGLDGARSWIIAGDLNRFVWPGVDLRPTRLATGEYAYGMLPRSLYRRVRDHVLELARAGRASVTGRDG